ncbi:glycosyltransferase 87 family protein [Blastococcus sp. Marseille-P5729]|uniref:glycosyltransferase 87 family protein n=1 Tax=Blastococcus sp. Marseille-P5729 TaxID=2086582 RepID=UPI00131BAEED|nr:glycosyltransferase 87 family protein [Blastococcus sp. Marseille-P5729]
MDQLNTHDAPRTRSTTRPRARHATTHRFVVALAWLAALAVTYAVLREYNPFASRPRMSDLQVYVGSAQWVLDGGALYEFRVGGDGLPFTYPPFGVLPFLPFAAVPYTAMKVLALLWAGASVLAIAYLIPRYARIFTAPDGLLARIPASIATPLLCIALGLSGPVLVGTRLGQISLLLVALVSIDVLVVCRRWPSYGGLITGFVAAVKLTPLAVLPALWLAGRRRQAYNGAGLFAVLSAIGVAIFPSAMVDYVTSKAGDLPRFGQYKGVPNQGLGALLMRMGMEGAAQKVLYLALALLVLVLAWRRAAALLRAGDDFSALIIIGAAMVVASPISWTHHQVWLWMAMFVMISRRPGVQIAWMVFLGFIMTFGVRAHITGHLGLPDVAWIDWVFANLRAFAAIAIAAVVPVVLLRSEGTPAPPRAPAPTADDDRGLAVRR